MCAVLCRTRGRRLRRLCLLSLSACAPEDRGRAPLGRPSRRWRPPRRWRRRAQRGLRGLGWREEKLRLRRVRGLLGLAPPGRPAPAAADPRRLLLGRHPLRLDPRRPRRPASPFSPSVGCALGPGAALEFEGGGRRGLFSGSGPPWGAARSAERGAQRSVRAAGPGGPGARAAAPGRRGRCCHGQDQPRGC